jgi:hypothetical protein
MSLVREFDWDSSLPMKAVYVRRIPAIWESAKFRCPGSALKRFIPEMVQPEVVQCEMEKWRSPLV